jgi:hypothetical protein
MSLYLLKKEIFMKRSDLRQMIREEILNAKMVRKLREMSVVEDYSAWVTRKKVNTDDQGLGGIPLEIIGYKNYDDDHPFYSFTMDGHHTGTHVKTAIATARRLRLNYVELLTPSRKLFGIIHSVDGLPKFVPARKVKGWDIKSLR